MKHSIIKYIKDTLVSLWFYNNLLCSNENETYITYDETLTIKEWLSIFHCITHITLFVIFVHIFLYI